MPVDVNFCFGKTDSERIENALAKLDEKGSDRVLLIPPRVCAEEPERDYWLIDRAILLKENTTVVLRNCRIKLSDRCRDNFFRSANCGMEIEDPAPIHDIYIKGEGICVLEGADHPRSTGDGSKKLACPCPKTNEDLVRLAEWVAPERKASGELNFDDVHGHTYGTDAGAEGESQYGDWRNIGILFARTERFAVENIRMVDYHCWGISLEDCAYGSISGIDFEAYMAKEIDGLLCNIENQDGIDLRNGCHDIRISDITGKTGDDMIALTAIAVKRKYSPGGSLRSTHVMHNDWSRRTKDIYNVTIDGVSGYSGGAVCWIVRLLPTESNIYNVVINNVIDTAPEGFGAGGVLLLGAGDWDYGRNLPGSLSDIVISNVIGGKNNRCAPVQIEGYLRDSVISGLINRSPDVPAIHIERGEEAFVNVGVTGVITSGGPVFG